MTLRKFNASKLTIALAAAIAAAACQSYNARTPALLVQTDSQTMTEVKSTLAEAMGVARITLGPGDLANTSTISALPPEPSSYEDRITARPTLFDLSTDGSHCFLTRRDTRAEYQLKNVSCRPAAD